MRDNATPYIIKSISIIRNNLSPFLIVLIASFLFILPMIEKTPNTLYFLIFGAVMLFIYPSIYGRYSEITLNRQAVPYSILFKRHWVNYFLISLLLGIPSAIFDLLRMFLEIEVKNFEVISSIVVSSLSIYVLPLVFIHGKKMESIKFGFQCTFGNLIFNLPLFLIVSATTIIGVLIEYPDYLSNRLHFIISYGALLIFNLFIEFLVFVSATLILKEKGLTEI